MKKVHGSSGIKLVLVLALIGALVAGCGGGQSTAENEQEQIEKIDKDLGLGVPDSGDARTEVEEMIRSQFAVSAKEATGIAAVVNSVTCVEHADPGSFECFVDASYAEYGEVVPMNVPVTATCDESNCTWRTTS
jgi:hypothetical protein